MSPLTLTPGTRLGPYEIAALIDNRLLWQYDVSRDGRFLINTVLDEAAAPITLIQNWRPEVKP